MKKFIWLTVDGEARTLSARSLGDAANKVIKFRMSLGESRKDAKEHHAKNDQIYEIIKDLGL